LSNASTVRKLVVAFGDMPLTQIDRSSIEGYRARRRDEGLSTGSRNRYLACLKAVLEKGVEWGYFRDNVAAGVKQENEARKLPRPYRESEATAILGALNAEQRDMATLYLHTALRRGC
jgi:site-specific recombinase XerD